MGGEDVARAGVIPRWRYRLERCGAYARRAFLAVARGPGRFPGGIDPLLGAAGGDTVVVTGWVRTGRRPANVAVFVDGEPAAFVAVDPVARGPSPDTRRWEATVALPQRDRVALDAVAVFGDGLNQRLLGRAASTPVWRPPAHDLDAPRDGDITGGPVLQVSGWAVDDDADRIEVRVDGDVTLARCMAQPRPDIARVTGARHAPMCGFEAVVDIADRRPGDVLVVEVDVVAGDGARRRVGRARVTVGAPPHAPPVDERRVARVRAATSASVAAPVAARGGAAGEHRLLVVTHHLGLGGGQLYLQDVVSGLLRGGGVRCTVVSPEDGVLRGDLEALGATVRVVGRYPLDPLGYEWLVHELVATAAEFGATAVIANTTGAFCAVDAAERLGLPSLWAIHESYPLEQFLVAAYGPGGVHPAVADRLRAALRSARAVLFEAEETRRLYEAHGDAQRFVHVPYGIAFDGLDAYRAGADRTALRDAHGFGRDDVVLLCLGTIEPRKAQASLARAFAAVAPDHPEAVLALVGHRGDDYGDAVSAYAASLGLGDRVRVVPVTPATYDWYAMADAFVLASDVESLPRSVLEAMAFELPVLATDVFGLSDTVHDGRTGFVVPPRRLGALAAGLRRVLEAGGGTRAAMGAQASAYVRAHHDSSGYVGAYRRLLDAFAEDPDALPGDRLRVREAGGVPTEHRPPA